MKNERTKALVSRERTRYIAAFLCLDNEKQRFEVSLTKLLPRNIECNFNKSLKLPSRAMYGRTLARNLSLRIADCYVGLGQKEM